MTRLRSMAGALAAALLLAACGPAQPLMGDGFVARGASASLQGPPQSAQQSAAAMRQGGDAARLTVQVAAPRQPGGADDLQAAGARQQAGGDNLQAASGHDGGDNLQAAARHDGAEVQANAGSAAATQQAVGGAQVAVEGGLTVQAASAMQPGGDNVQAAARQDGGEVQTDALGAQTVRQDRGDAQRTAASAAQTASAMLQGGDAVRLTVQAATAMQHGGDVQANVESSAVTQQAAASAHAAVQGVGGAQVAAQGVGVGGAQLAEQGVGVGGVHAGERGAGTARRDRRKGLDAAAAAIAQGADNALVSPEEVAREWLARMTLEQKVGQVFMLGFVGTSLDDSNRALIQGLHLGGVTLFGRNIDDAAQLSQLDHDLQTVADPVPLFISVDQEGGLVVRVTDGATIFPGNMAVGATGDPQVARQVAVASATEMQAMGINMFLGPVVDVNTNPLNPVIGVRSYGSSVDLVTQMAAAAVEGTQSVGVSAVAKHFPGHGDTSVDSHLDLPVVPHPLERLESLEFKPFEASMQAGVDGIMTAHLYLPRIEPQPDLPATLSRTVLTGILRDQLGYQGLVLTDALDMDAIKKDRTAADAAVDAFDAGADMLLIAGITADDRSHLGDGPPALLEAVHSGRISEARLDQSVLRILEAKARRGVLPGSIPPPAAPDASVLNSTADRALALDVARRAVTLQRDNAGLLPLSPSSKVLVVEAPSPTRSEVVDDTLASSLIDAVKQFAPGALGVTPQNAVSAAANADIVVFGTFDLAQNAAQQTLAAELAATGKPVIGVSLRGPYDAAVATEIGTYVTVYGDRPVHVQAAAEALFGKVSPGGQVP